MARKKAPISNTPYFFNEKAERRRLMVQACAKYNPHPFQEMTPTEVWQFSFRLAHDSITSCSLTPEEEITFAKVVFNSIQFFNQQCDQINHQQQSNQE